MPSSLKRPRGEAWEFSREDPLNPDFKARFRSAHRIQRVGYRSARNVSDAVWQAYTEWDDRHKDAPQTPPFWSD